MIAERRGFAAREAAEMIAVDALSWLTESPDALARFLSESGLDPAAIRSAAADPAFLGGVLDFLATHEALLIDYAEHAGIPPERVMAAWRRMNGEMENPA